MAARLSGRRPLALAAALALAVGGCASTERPTVQPDVVELPSPMRSPSADVAATITDLEGAAATVPTRLVEPTVPYRPSEPQTIIGTPRAVLRADLADPGDGHIVIYDPDGADATRAAADELAAYLGSGFGQTNFAADAQFSVAIVGDTVVFTTWSRSRSSDPEAAEAVFDAVAAVGEAIEVRK